MARSRFNVEPRHVRLYEWLTNSPAWRSLGCLRAPALRRVQVPLQGQNNGDIAFSGDEMMCGAELQQQAADRALKTLMERGFLKLSKKGHFDWKRRAEGGSRSNTYTLTEYGIDWPERSAMPATKEFMRWRPDHKPLSATPRMSKPPKKCGVTRAPEWGTSSTRLRSRWRYVVTRMEVRRHPMKPQKAT